MPDFDDLRSELEAQPTIAEERMSEIAQLVRERSDRLQSVLDERDRTEFAAALFVGVGYAIGALFFSAPLAKIGGVIAVLGSIEIVILMKLARRPADAHAMAGSLADSLSHEVTMVERQIALLKHVAWWYILPLYVGACLFVAGISSWWFAAIFAVGYFFICYRIWLANQTARRSNLEPLRDRLVAAREVVLNPDAPDDVRSEAVRELAQDTFDQDTFDQSPADQLKQEQAVQHSKDILRAVGRFFDAIIVLVLMCWGGMTAGSMLDSTIAGKPLTSGEDGVCALIGFFLAGAYSLWTKPVNWSVLWMGVVVPKQRASDKKEPE